MRKLAAIGTLLLLLSGCGDTLNDTWNKFTTPDFSWSENQDRAVSADRTSANAAQAPMGAMSYQAQPSNGRAAAPAARSTSRTAAAGGCYRGKLTGEGMTCQAMRTDGGDLLMLAGPRRGFGTGDSVCVCGIPSAEQFCGQGMTLLIREIDVDCRDIR